MGLTLDSAAAPEVIERVRVEIDAGPARFIVLDE
jgi:hypothetical protein